MATRGRKRAAVGRHREGEGRTIFLGKGPHKHFIVWEAALVASLISPPLSLHVSPRPGAASPGWIVASLPASGGPAARIATRFAVLMSPKRTYAAH